MPATDTLSLGIKQQALPILWIALCLVLAYLVLRWVASLRVRRLARERDGVTETSFAEMLEKDGFDPVISRSTFRYLQEVQGIRFPILPTDDLDVDLGLDSDDIKQTLADLSNGLQRNLSSALLHKPLITVEDLIRVLQASPRRSSEAAA